MFNYLKLLFLVFFVLTLSHCEETEEEEEATEIAIEEAADGTITATVKKKDDSSKDASEPTAKTNEHISSFKMTFKLLRPAAGTDWSKFESKLTSDVGKEWAFFEDRIKKGTFNDHLDKLDDKAFHIDKIEKEYFTSDLLASQGGKDSIALATDVYQIYFSEGKRESFGEHKIFPLVLALDADLDKDGELALLRWIEDGDNSTWAAVAGWEKEEISDNKGNKKILFSGGVHFLSSKDYFAVAKLNQSKTVGECKSLYDSNKNTDGGSGCGFHEGETMRPDETGTDTKYTITTGSCSVHRSLEGDKIKNHYECSCPDGKGSYKHIKSISGAEPSAGVVDCQDCPEGYIGRGCHQCAAGYVANGHLCEEDNSGDGSGPGPGPGDPSSPGSPVVTDKYYCHLGYVNRVGIPMNSYTGPDSCLINCKGELISRMSGGDYTKLSGFCSFYRCSIGVSSKR